MIESEDTFLDGWHLESLTSLIAAAYLCCGLAASISPAIYLIFVPSRILFARPAVEFFGALALAIGPYYAIAYALMRRRKWGWYLLVVYNGAWFAFITFDFIDGVLHNPRLRSSLLIAPRVVVLLLIGGLVAFACRKDVRTLMSR